MSEVADGILTIPLGRPENLFDLGPMRAEPDLARVSMPTGPWLLGPGDRPSPAGLGVLVDVVLGQAVLTRRTSQRWAVTTELHVDVVAPLPSEGQLVQATARPVSVDDGGGLARAHVQDAAGRPLARASTWMRFIPGVPAAILNPPPLPAIADRGQRLTDLLQVKFDDGGGLSLPARPDLGNPRGVLHGGVLFCLAVLSAESLVAGSGLSTASVRIIYLRPATGELSVTATALHRGRSLAVTRVDVRTTAGDLCTTTTVTARSSVGP